MSYWVGDNPSTPSLSASDLHARGDRYGGWRLPEDNIRFKDEDGIFHDLHVIGRYLQCREHFNSAAQSMIGFSLTNDPKCSELARVWNHSFRPGLSHIPFDKVVGNTIRLPRDDRFYAMRRIVYATIVERIRETTNAIIEEIDDCLTLFPEMWKDPDWLQGHREAGVLANDWGVMRKIGLTQELTPLALIERPKPFSLTSFLRKEAMEVLRNSPSADALETFWLKGRRMAEKVIEYQDRLSVHVLVPSIGLNVLLELFIDTPFESIRDLLLSYSETRSSRGTPTTLPWIVQGLHDPAKNLLADKFAAICPSLSPAKIAHLAAQWDEYSINEFERHSDDQQLAALTAQMLGYGHICYTIPPPTTPSPCPGSHDAIISDLAWRPGWDESLGDDAKINSPEL
jgi:hypothetical protein